CSSRTSRLVFSPTVSASYESPATTSKAASNPRYAASISSRLEPIHRTLVRTTDKNGASASGAVEQLRRPENPCDPNLDHHPPRIDPRGAVPLGVTKFGVADGLGVGIDRGAALQGQPSGAVDLAEHGDAALFGIDGLLRPTAGDD